MPSRRTKQKGKIIIISGPSGSGKTTLHKKLLRSPKFKKSLVKSISATTRAIRPGEKQGRDYIFLSPAEFLRKKKAGHFLEWEKVFGNHYGTPKQAAERLLKAGKNVLLCIDVKGARTVARQHPEAVRIFIKVPSMTVLKKRLQARGTETRAHLDLRLRIARKEMQEARLYDYVLVNDDLTKAYRQLESLIKKVLTQDTQTACYCCC